MTTITLSEVKSSNPQFSVQKPMHIFVIHIDTFESIICVYVKVKPLYILCLFDAITRGLEIRC